MDPRTHGGENELGDGDQDAAAALVADAEDLFAICFALDLLENICKANEKAFSHP